MSTVKKPFSRPVSIAVANAKGGVGKSTHALNIGYYYHSTYALNVLILDTEKRRGISDIDYQGAVIEGKKFDIKHHFDAEMLSDFLELALTKYDLVVVDTAGIEVSINSGCDESQEQVNSEVLTSVDYVLTPLRPTAIDARKTANFCSMVAKYQKARRGTLGAGLFFNEWKKNSVECREAYEQIRQAETIFKRVAIFDATIRSTSKISKAYGHGQSALEYGRAHFSATDIRSLCKELTLSINAHVEKVGG